MVTTIDGELQSLPLAHVDLEATETLGADDALPLGTVAAAWP